jgi:tetratricopeptide (TPR) repeat protein
MAADQRGDPARAIPHLRAAVDLCDGDEPTEASAERRRRRQAARVHRALASALLGLKEYASARAEAETALALQEALGDRLGQVEALNILGIVCMEQGMLDDATGCYWRALESCRAIGYRYGEARALGNWGNVLYVQGALDKALGRYDQAAAIFRDIGHRRGEAIVRLNTADIRLSVYGDVEHARADVEAVLAYAREAGEHATEGQSLTVLGQAAWQLGDLAEARHLLETSVAVLKEAGEQWLEAQACITLVHVRLDEGQPEAALADLLAVEAMCRERGMASLQGDLSTARGAVLLALGRPDEALAAIERAEEQPGSGVQRTYLAPYTRYRASRALGREPEARAAIEQAQQAVLDLIKGLSPQEQETSLRQQPEFRAIVETWQAACG